MITLSGIFSFYKCVNKYFKKRSNLKYREFEPFLEISTGKHTVFLSTGSSMVFFLMLSSVCTISFWPRTSSPEEDILWLSDPVS